MRAALVVLAVAGCYSPAPPAGVPCGEDDVCPGGQACIAGVCAKTDGVNLDAPADDSGPAIDAPALCATWTARHFDPCMLPAPGGDLTLTPALAGYSWDTSKPELKGKMNTTIPVTTMVVTQAVGPDVLVASVNNFTLDAGVTVDLKGSRALLIAVWGNANIAGTIDASASYSVAGPGGAGASSNTLGCGGALTGDFGVATTPATGAGGGAFQGSGGQGGNVGGLPGAGIAPPMNIQGGCAGGNGGAGSSGLQGIRGAGGGAVVVAARESITITSSGVIHAGGGGGSQGRANYGAGGGGGAGGYVGLDAPSVTVAGTLAANGGGGGGGASDYSSATSGQNGRSDGSPALGGAGATASNVGNCNKGGNGSAGGTLVGAAGGTSLCGGGGGGGGAGYILIWSPALDVSGTISPPATAGP
jgi:hypothetical protein